MDEEQVTASCGCVFCDLDVPADDRDGDGKLFHWVCREPVPEWVPCTRS